MSFAAAVAARESQIVLGLDPDPANLWPAAVRAAERATGSAAERAGAAVLEQCRLLIDAAGPACVATKPQLACFERLGAAGWAALERTVELSHDAGLLVIADGKRGDVPVTAAAYAQALAGVTPTVAGEVSGLRADAFTANPLLGADALAPLIATGATVFILVRTSNPGAADVQDLAMADGRPLWEHLAALADRLGTGAVLGATAPGHLARARELMPRATLLLPGIGAQGGRVEELAPAFAPGPAGGLVAAARSIAGAYERRGGDPAGAAREEAERLRELAWNLAR